MYQSQGGFPPQPAQHFQQGYNSNQGYTGPPPAKRPKGNPIITRYPPPPGYRGPAQPQAPYAQPGWPQSAPAQGYAPVPQGYPPQQGYPQAQAYPPAAYPSYPHQPYGSTPSQYPQQQWPAHQQQAYSQPGYPPQAQTYMQPPNAHVGSHQTWQQGAPQQATMPQTWQPPASSFPPQDKRPSSTSSFSHGRTHSVGPVDGNGDPLPPQTAVPGSAEDLADDDYEGECYFARYPEAIDPSLSLGIIEWHAAVPTSHALPATHQEAELEAVAPRKFRTGDGESVSDYFVGSRRDDAFLSVRQTDLWAEVQYDPIFREFPTRCEEILLMSEVLERFRDRVDPTWAHSNSQYASASTPNTSRQQTPAEHDNSSDAIEVKNEFPSSHHIKSELSGNSDNVLDNLEQALFSTEDQGGYHAKAGANGSTHSRTASMTSQPGERITRPVPLAPIRDRVQEDFLATLGVTGSPKLVYQTPAPAIGPPPNQQHNNGGSRTGTFNSQHAPPPPPQQGNGWVSNGHRSNGTHFERRSSGGSQHTAAGSDFHGDDDPDATPRPQKMRNENRKRSHADSDDGERERERNEDTTPKQRRKQPRVEAAYSRRW